MHLKNSEARKTILVTDTYPTPLLAQLQKNLPEFHIANTQVSEILNQRHKEQNVVGLLIRSQTQVTAKLLEELPHLQIVGTATSGFDHIDLKASLKRQVILFHTPDANADSTADLTLWHILSCLRHLGRSTPLAWRTDLNRGTEAKGLQLGLLGFGRIGQRVALRALSFGMNILYYDPYLDDENPWRDELQASVPESLHPLNSESSSKLQKLGLMEVLAQADIISLHLPSTPLTYQMINHKTLDHVGDNKILINCARGDLIEPSALLHALQNGTLSCVGLDTFASEPLAADSPLRQHPQVVWTPHIGAYTDEAYNHSCGQAIQIMTQYFLQAQIPKSLLPPQAPWAADLLL